MIAHYLHWQQHLLTICQLPLQLDGLFNQPPGIHWLACHRKVLLQHRGLAKLTMQGARLQPVDIKPLGKKMTIVFFFLCIDCIYSDYISHQPPHLLSILPNWLRVMYQLACSQKALPWCRNPAQPNIKQLRKKITVVNFFSPYKLYLF